MKKTCLIEGTFPFSKFFLNPTKFIYKENYKPIYYKGLCVSNYLQMRYMDDSIPHHSFAIEPTSELLDLMDDMLRIDKDSIYFELIVYTDNTAMLIAKYNLIIGSRWIAMIDVDSIPEYKKEYQNDNTE
jgi:hypothetical protein